MIGDGAQAPAILSVLPVCEWNVISMCAIEESLLDLMGPEAVSGLDDPGRIAPVDTEAIFRDFRRLRTAVNIRAVDGNAHA